MSPLFLVFVEYFAGVFLLGIGIYTMSVMTLLPSLLLSLAGLYLLVKSVTRNQRYLKELEND